MVMSDILKDITEKYYDFSMKEQVVATYLLQNAADIENISIHKLSELIGISASTITRFCRKIGCGSFGDLKMKLNRLAGQKNDKKRSMNVFEKISEYYTDVINRTVRLLSQEQVARLIEDIIRAKRIIIYGIGSSGLTAKEMAVRLARMGINATSESDSHTMVIQSTVVSSNTLVIAISNSGETKEIVESIKLAKKNQAKIIGITSIPNSSVDKVSDETFFVHNTKWVNNNQFVNSQFSIYFLLDIVSLLLLQNHEYSQNMSKTIDALVGENIKK